MKYLEECGKNVFYGVHSKYKKNCEAERTSYGISHGVFQNFF